MTVRLLLIDRLPPLLHGRLENWGEVMRGGGGRKPAKLATYDVIQSMHEHAGQTRNLSTHLARSLDLADAPLIEAYLCASTYRIVPNQRAIARAHYVERGSWQMTCRVLGIQQHLYDDRLVEAVLAFEHFMSWAKVSEVATRRQDTAR